MKIRTNKGLNDWGINLWNTIRGIKKDLPDVNKEIRNFINEQNKLFDGIYDEHIEILRPQLIQVAKSY